MRFGNTSGKSQTLVSMLLICVLAGIVAGVWVKQYYYDKSYFITDVMDANSGQGGGQSKGLASISPAGFTAGEAQVFDEKTLYEKIDGKADLYLESGFKKMTCQMFTKVGQEDKWFEFYAYDMGKGLNAFAVYGVQKRPEGEIIGAAKLAYKTADAVFLCKGRYYCEIMSSGVDGAVSAAMVEAAEKFVKDFAGEAGEIEELEIFPRDDLVSGSYKLYIAEAYGYDKFKNTFSAIYNVNGKSVTAFVLKAQTKEEANELAAEYKKFIIENAQAEQGASEKKELSGAVLDMGGLYEIVFANGLYVGGVHEAEDKSAGETVAGRLYDALTKASEAGKKI